MTNSDERYRFDVAFSFAGPHRAKVLAVAELVAAALGKHRVFFDDWYQHEILGDDMDVLLQRFYLQQSLIVVADLSDDYSERAWCQAEARAIRALRMRIDSARDETQRLRLLNVRYGPGDVPGVSENTGYFDGQNKTVGECANLILKRLGLLRERLTPGNVKGSEEHPPLDVAISWPETFPTLPAWPMADHTEARAAFERLLTRDAPWRCLLLRGSSEVGKSHITRQMLANAIQVPDFACGRLDFKGTTDVEGELSAFVQYLEIPSPDTSPRLNDRLTRIVDALKVRRKPALLIFDTYEDAGEAQGWVEKQLLLRVMREPWLRVVIAGQKVPEPAGAVWATIVRLPLHLQPPPPEAWLAFGQPYKPSITLEFVRQAHALCGGKATVLAQLLGPS